MSRKLFTEEQQQLLRQNPYIYSVTETRITLTKDFKEIFMTAYKAGKSPRKILVLNVTVFSVLTTGVMSTGKDGTALTQAAFMKGFGSAGIIFVAVCLFFFAFSTILSWHFFGLVNVKYLFGEKASKLYSLIVVACIVIGSCLKLELVWSLADFFNGLMVIPNVLALLALSGLVARASKER